MEKPEFAKYDIKFDYGFLPKSCLNKLPERFECLRDALDHLSDNDINYRNYFTNIIYDDAIHKIDESNDNAELKFMYSILTMMINKYTWCTNSTPYHVNIPDIIGKPWIKIAKILGIENRSFTNPAIWMWNWSLINDTVGFTMNNIKINHTMTDEPSEVIFYKTMIINEYGISQLLTSIVKLPGFRVYDSKSSMNDIIKNLNKSIQLFDINQQFGFSPNKSDNKFSVYINSRGGKTPYTLNIDNEKIIYMNWLPSYSRIICVYDKLLGIEHNTNNGELGILLYTMTKKHRDYINDINDYCNCRKIVIEQNNSELNALYDQCVGALLTYRNTFLKFIQKYMDNSEVPWYSDFNKDNLVEIYKTLIDDTKKSLIKSYEWIKLGGLLLILFIGYKLLKK